MSATPVEKFGKDHWSMMAYVETLCVDGKEGIGTIDRRRVRCNQNKHPLLAAVFLNGWRSEWSTRLTGFFDFPDRSNVARAVAAGVMLLDHDDWDCLEDLEAAGYVEILSMVNGHVRLTKEGKAVSALLRQHKADGHHFASFKLANAVAA